MMIKGNETLRICVCARYTIYSSTVQLLLKEPRPKNNNNEHWTLRILEAISCFCRIKHSLNKAHRNKAGEIEITTTSWGVQNNSSFYSPSLNRGYLIK